MGVNKRRCWHDQLGNFGIIIGDDKNRIQLSPFHIVRDSLEETCKVEFAYSHAKQTVKKFK